MGTYLSTPVTDKCEESGESMACPDVPCAWGVVDMQGWRKSMEDAHTAVTDIPLPQQVEENNDAAISLLSDAKVFGVFDGHGGPEVARFCQLYLVSVLQQQPTWKELPTTPDSPLLPSPDDQEAAAETPVGKALRSAFHALDRMIDDPSRRQELVQLRNSKPMVGERKEATDIPPPQDISHIVPPAFYTIATELDKQISDSEELVETGSEDGKKGEQNETNPAKEENEEQQQPALETEESPASAADAEGRVEDSSSTDAATGDNEKASVEEDDRDNSKDDDSTEAVGKEEAAEQDRDMMDGDDDNNNNSDSPKENDTVGEEENSNTGKVTTMFQKILSLGGAPSGQVVVNISGGSGQQSAADQEDNTTGPSARRPTIIHQGRMICNLPDHPIHAGATAIVAVITGRILTVANAGDSRAVLCRANGVTYPLSFDHKPQQDREMNRITRAGGFVNHFGRVNGNLNLSRSIGDLKYKQVPGIPPPHQMITAEPDIMQVALQPDDEFIILGCDGIWDCLTNENAVDYVRKRIDKMTPTEIGREMLDQIISDDPRVTQGIGGDNMTVMIIDLQPSSRSLRQKGSEEQPPEDVTTTTVTTTSTDQ